MTTEPRRARKWLRVVIPIFVVLALAFFGDALAQAWHKTHGKLPPLTAIAPAVGCIALSLFAGAWAWSTLLGGEDRVDHGAALLTSQLAKYVPGAIWQAAGQIGLAKAAGVSVKRGATAFSVHALAQALAGVTFALPLALVWTSVNGAVRILLVVGALACLALLDRRWMVWALGRIPRTRDTSSELVPPQRPILSAWVASLVVLGATSVAYFLMLRSVTPVHHGLLVVAAYAVAWTVGFVAVPIPSGLGIREAVLVAILHGTAPTSVLVAASVYHRLLTIATEGALAAIAAQRVRTSHRRRSLTDPEPTESA